MDGHQSINEESLSSSELQSQKKSDLSSDGGYVCVTLNHENIKIPSNYNPLYDQGDYMNKTQRAFFKKRLIDWKLKVEDETKKKIDKIKFDLSEDGCSETGDIAYFEESIFFEFRTGDRKRKLIQKINNAITMIETGDYGYCKKTGDEIGIPRLLARPIATMTTKVQSAHESNEDIIEEAENSTQRLSKEVGAIKITSADEESEESSDEVENV